MPPLVQSSTARKRLNGPICVPGLENFSYGFGAQEGVLGAGVSFGISIYVYIGSRVIFK